MEIEDKIIQVLYDFSCALGAKKSQNDDHQFFKFYAKRIIELLVIEEGGYGN